MIRIGKILLAMMLIYSLGVAVGCVGQSPKTANDVMSKLIDWQKTVRTYKYYLSTSSNTTIQKFPETPLSITPSTSFYTHSLTEYGNIDVSNMHYSIHLPKNQSDNTSVLDFPPIPYDEYYQDGYWYLDFGSWTKIEEDYKDWDQLNTQILFCNSSNTTILGTTFIDGREYYVITLIPDSSNSLNWFNSHLDTLKYLAAFPGSDVINYPSKIIEENIYSSVKLWISKSDYSLLQAEIKMRHQTTTALEGSIYSTDNVTLDASSFITFYDYNADYSDLLPDVARNANTQLPPF